MCVRDDRAGTGRTLSGSGRRRARPVASAACLVVLALPTGVAAQDGGRWLGGAWSLPEAPRIDARPDALGFELALRDRRFIGSDLLTSLDGAESGLDFRLSLREAAAAGFGGPVNVNVWDARIGLGLGDDVFAVAKYGRVGESGETASLGLVYQTRAGDRLVLEIQPDVTWRSGTGFSIADDRLYGRIAADPAQDSTRMGFGATATYSIMDDWYVRGLARISRLVSGAPDNPMDPQTDVVGGFMTGYRF